MEMGGWVAMMAAMMLPAAIPAVVRAAHAGDGARTVALFVGSYLAVWALVGVVVYALYRPHEAVAAAVVVIAAGIYELTPLKRYFRRRCRETVRSGIEFGLCCVGSCIGLIARTEEQQRSGPVEYNFRPMDMRPALNAPPESWVAQIAANAGTDVASYMREGPGMSAFALKDGVVYHTYSSYGRGLDALWGMYQWLDRAPFGRNEDGEWWFRRHDEYERT